jgi:polyhydroxybutyrate depolymerase
LAKHFGLAAVAELRRVAIVVPSGHRDSTGRRYWNAGAACCDFDGRAPNDTGRLRGLIEYGMRELRIDPARVFVIGFSNGGFMAHRLACEVGDLVRAAVSVAGPAVNLDGCRITQNLAILHIHGDADRVVRYGGGRVFDDPRLALYPSADQTFRDWRKRLGCTGTTPGRSFDLEPSLAGQETVATTSGRCERGWVELWRVRGGEHEIAQSPLAFEAIWRFLEHRVKP